MKPDPSNYYYYNKHLLKNAKNLRRNMTKAESCLWKYVLRAGGMKGFTFRRQRPVLNYIADFMSKELLLIIEVDGIIHTYEEVIQKDKKRQEDLERAGFTVIRFTNDEVLHHINAVYAEIESKVVEIMESKGISAPQRKRGQKRSGS